MPERERFKRAEAKLEEWGMLDAVLQSIQCQQASWPVEGVKEHEGKGTDEGVAAAILLRNGDLLKNLAAAESALLNDASGPPIFQRGGALVYLHRWPVGGADENGIRRKAGALTIELASPEWLRLRMAATASYERYNEKAKRNLPHDPPLTLARSLLSATTNWKFKPLTGIIEAPTLRADGSVLVTPGYDEASGLYLELGDLG